ncbi:MAG: hypothetical protein MUP24_10390 [Gillisia sp.]|nr:hypothetical protein [Gillisia sp.]
MEKAGLLWEVNKSFCKARVYKNYYLTTNPKNFKSSQLKLFCDDREE